MDATVHKTTQGLDWAGDAFLVPIKIKVAEMALIHGPDDWLSKPNQRRVEEQICSQFVYVPDLFKKSDSDNKNIGHHLTHRGRHACGVWGKIMKNGKPYHPNEVTKFEEPEFQAILELARSSKTVTKHTIHEAQSTVRLLQYKRLHGTYILYDPDMPHHIAVGKAELQTIWKRVSQQMPKSTWYFAHGWPIPKTENITVVETGIKAFLSGHELLDVKKGPECFYMKSGIDWVVEVDNFVQKYYGGLCHTTARHKILVP
jgi:hypothetical protein